ncbi:hypothetical protein ACJ41O_002210 [Fusarium nematophilum]
MLGSTILYVLLSIMLFGLAVSVHVRSSSLSLATSPAVSILTILLPIVAPLNALFQARLRRASISPPSRAAQLTPLVVQVLQALATTILATLLFQGVVPSAAMECMLDTEWMRMFRAHDASGIRRIQDAFDCCGLNSVRDRAYPFPGMAPSSCAETYGRRIACREPWRGALQTASGLDLAVVLGVGLMQILSLLLGAGRWNTWGHRNGGQATDHRESQRPLLTGGSVIEEDEPLPQQQDSEPRGYASLSGNGIGPIVEPSVVAERNQWRDD